MKRPVWVIASLLVAIAVVGTIGWIAFRAFERPVQVACDQEEEPDPTGNFVMRFDVTNGGRSPATKLDFQIADTGLDGSPRGEFSRYTLSGSFPPGRTVARTEEVPQPPNYRTLKFSKIDCTLDRVVFSDGSAWP